MPITFEQLPLISIILDSRLQPRTEINSVIVKDYKEKLEAGIELSPLTVFYDGDRYYLADGFHTFMAYSSLRYEQVPCLVMSGSFEDAFNYALTQANVKQGQALTRKDNIRRIQLALASESYRGLSDEDLARKLSVSLKLIQQTKYQSDRKNVSADEKDVEPVNTPKRFPRPSSVPDVSIEGNEVIDDLPQFDAVIQYIDSDVYPKILHPHTAYIFLDTEYLAKFKQISEHIVIYWLEYPIMVVFSVKNNLGSCKINSHNNLFEVILSKISKQGDNVLVVNCPIIINDDLGRSIKVIEDNNLSALKERM